MPKSHTQVDARNAKIDTSSRLINVRTKETQILIKNLMTVTAEKWALAQRRDLLTWTWSVASAGDTRSQREMGARPCA